jgi:hypothetical protein
MGESKKSRILVWRHKHGTDFFDASNPDREAGAYLSIFEGIRAAYGDYPDLTELDPAPKRPAGHVEGCRCGDCQRFEAEQKTWPREKAEQERLRKLYELARLGDAASARELITARSDYEYEEVTTEWVEINEAKYPPDPDKWGVEKPCSVAYVTEDGLVREIHHGKEPTSIRKYPSFAAAKKRLTADFPAKHLPQDFAAHRERWRGELQDHESLKKLGTFDKDVKVVAMFERRMCSFHQRQAHRFEAD